MNPIRGMSVSGGIFLHGIGTWQMDDRLAQHKYGFEFFRKCNQNHILYGESIISHCPNLSA